MVRKDFQEWFIRLFENEEELPQDVSKYTSQMWYDSLLDDYFDWYGELPEQDLLKLLKYEQQHNQNFSYQKIPFPKKYVYIQVENGQTTYVYEADNNGMFERKEPQEWLRDIEWGNSSHEYFGEFSDEKFNKEFWQYPPPLYHGTNNIESVLQNGLEPKADTRGINNRSTGAAVFASTNPEAVSSYATDGIVVIDTESMKRNGFTPWVTMEGPLEDVGQLNAIAHAIGIDYDASNQYSSEGIEEETVVIHDAIPSQYISKFESY